MLLRGKWSGRCNDVIRKNVSHQLERFIKPKKGCTAIYARTKKGTKIAMYNLAHLLETGANHGLKRWRSSVQSVSTCRGRKNTLMYHDLTWRTISTWSCCFQDWQKLSAVATFLQRMIQTHHALSKWANMLLDKHSRWGDKQRSEQRVNQRKEGQNASSVTLITKSYRTIIPCLLNTTSYNGNQGN